jgi:hypothetical protein
MMDSDSEDTDSASSVQDLAEELAEGHESEDVTAPNEVWNLPTRCNALFPDLNIGTIRIIQHRSHATPNSLRDSPNRGPHS